MSAMAEDGGLRRGLLLNFDSAVLKDGMRRMVL